MCIRDRAIITETWFSSSEEHDQDLDDVLQSTGIALITKNLPPLVVAAYMPPGDSVQRGKACLAHIGRIVLDAKRRYNEPMIVVASDFNQWDIKSALDDYVNLEKVDAGATRGARSIDRVFLNFGSAITKKGTVPPPPRN